MKKISSFLALLLFAFTAFQVRAKESFVDKTPEWWEQATPQMVENLITDGADVNVRDQNGRTALIFSAGLNPNPEVIDILIKNGADIKAKDNNGFTALMIAAALNSNSDIIETLIKNGADIEAKTKDKQEWTAAFLAVMLNTSPNVINTLIKHGTNVNAKRRDESTLLMTAACYNSNPEIITTLIKQGANIHTRNSIKQTALHIASWRNSNPEIIETLIKNGANIEAKDNNGFTALMTSAAYNSNPDIIDLLIKHGANVNAKDNADNTALDYAQENPYLYNTDAYRLLEEKTNNKKIKIVNHNDLNCTIEHNKQICEEANLTPFTGIAMFYHLGNLLSKTSYKNGLVDGKVKAYDAYDAYMYLEADYKQGELLSATCYDKNGKIIQCKCDRFNWRIKQIMKQCR